MRLNASWRKEFTRSDLSGAVNYFLEESVCDLEERDGGWYAKVGRSNPHEAFVPAEPATLDGKRCDCETFANGRSCDHLAALCMVIEAKAKEKSVRVTSEPDKPAIAIWSPEGIRALLETVSDADLRAFMFEVLSEDEMLCHRFAEAFGQTS